VNGWTILTWAQLLFFAMGAFYFFRRSGKRASGGDFSKEENVTKMKQLSRMRNQKLTEPMSEQTRPKCLGEIVGQDKAIRALRAALCGPNPQHILIYGPPGVGKTAAARLILEEAKQKEESPFLGWSKFIEIDATNLQFDERNIADPLLGSVHDPIYQGAGAFGQAGVPQPRQGAVCDAHGGILFIDEIGEMHPLRMNKLLKVLEDRVAYFQSSYYTRENRQIPPYIHEIFQKGIPADFRLIGATTRSPNEISPALRSRCTEIYFEALDKYAIEEIARNSLYRAGISYEEGLCKAVADYTRGGRDTVNIIQSLVSLVSMEGRGRITFKDLEWVAETGRYQAVMQRKVNKRPQVGMVNGLAVQGIGGNGTLLLVEAYIQKALKGGLTVTGIVEEEELKGRNRTSRRKSTARSSAENVLTVLERYGFSKENYQVHINFPGGTPVDGPSAGVAMFLAVYSAFTNKAVSGVLALSGEIGLNGQVLPVGGVSEKLIAAEESGVEIVFIPRGNWKEAYRDMPLKVIAIRDIKELISRVFKQEGEERFVLDEQILTAKEQM